ncbi:MAG: hypothetical protein IKM59_01165 [Oscillospiraceae bacterium]|nr:hypothetical protein [Oscillospiraceae bacterium]
MDKIIPFEKLSKKEQKKRNAEKRGSWGSIKPVTRKPENPKAYNRRKARNCDSYRRDAITGSFYGTGR